jgi:hypothetical protein
MGEENIVVAEMVTEVEIDKEKIIKNKFFEELKASMIKCDQIREEYIKFTQVNNDALLEGIEKIKNDLSELEKKYVADLTLIEKNALAFNENYKKKVDTINTNKENDLAALYNSFQLQMEKSNELLNENERQYRIKIDELNSLRDKHEEESDSAREFLANSIDEELEPLKQNANDEIKKIEVTIQQNREDASSVLAALKRKYDADVRQIYKKTAQINDAYNAEAALIKKNYNDEIAKIEEKEELRRQHLLLQIDALKIQYEDEKSKLVKKSVEAIAVGNKKEAKEFKAKTVSLEKFFQSNLQSEQKDAEVDFKAIEEQRNVATHNLNNKLKELKDKQIIALEENAHALRVLQLKYECELQKKNLSRDIVENELAERLYKQENANKLAISSVNIQGDIKDRQLVYELNLYTLDYNKANNENYIDYQCFKINQEHKQSSYQLNYDLEVKNIQMKYKKELLSVNKQKEIEILKSDDLRKCLDLDYYYSLFVLDQKRLELEFATSRTIKHKGNQAKLERIKTMCAPYLNKLDNEFAEVKKQYEYLISVENDEYKELVSQIEVSHNRELNYIKSKLEQVVNYKNNLVSDLKQQLENSLINCNSRYKVMSDESLKNHNKIIKGYEQKIAEAQAKLDSDKAKYLDSMINSTVNEVVNYTTQLADSEYNGALSHYKYLIDTIRLKTEAEKVESQRQIQTAINNLNIEFSKNIEALDNEYKNFKALNEARLKEEETIKLNRLSEIEKNRQSVLLDYQTAKQNSQKQFENDILNFEAKLSSLEQEIERNNALKAQSTMKMNSDLMKNIAALESNLERHITASKQTMEKTLKAQLKNNQI